MIRCIGYDLNGWRDLAVRSWSEGVDGTDVQEPIVISGGAGGVVIAAQGRGGTSQWVGGLQALRAPHGRGGGWGAIGDQPRIRVTDLLSDTRDSVTALAAALRAMADPTRAISVLAIPDRPGLAEEDQEHLLDALRKAGAPRRLLVWRPVLAALAALDRTALTAGMTVGYVGHTGQGLSWQVLRLRDNTGTITPERRDIGRHQACDWGLEPICARGTAPYAEVLTDRRGPQAGACHLTAHCLGDSVEDEPIRRANGDWSVLTYQAGWQPPFPCIPPAMVSELATCTVTVLDTPLSGELRAALIRQLIDAGLGNLWDLGPDTVAKGGLIAAQRLSAGRPVYFDFLPQISTIVWGKDGPESHDLIPSDAVLPAGKMYRSVNPARFAIKHGVSTLNVYLRKDASGACRLGKVSLSTPPDGDAHIDLVVEQVPASGRARLVLTSPALISQMTVDWDTAEPLHMDWSAVLASLGPQVPERFVWPCSMAVWRGDVIQPGFSEALLYAHRTDDWNWPKLRDYPRSRFEGAYPIASDGTLPDGLPSDVIAALDTATERAVHDLYEAVRTAQYDDNHLISFLSWQFHRCPEEVGDLMLEGLRGGIVGRPAGSSRLLRHGLGRVLRSESRIEAALDLMFRDKPNTWTWDHVACVAFLLTRTDVAPHLMTPRRVARSVDVIGQKLAPWTARNVAQQAYLATFLVGLVRTRLARPTAFLAGEDAAADRALVALDRILQKSHKEGNVAKLQQLVASFQSCRDLISGGDGNASLLRTLAELTG